MKQKFIKGRTYAAGADFPPLVPESVIREQVEARGFDVVNVWDCGEGGVPFKVTGTCGEDFDTIAIVVRTGEDEEIELPPQVAWVVDLSQQAEKPSPGSPSSPSSPGTPAASSPWALLAVGGLALGALAAGGYALGRWLDRRR